MLLAVCCCCWLVRGCLRLVSLMFHGWYRIPYYCTLDSWTVSVVVVVGYSVRLGTGTVPYLVGLVSRIYAAKKDFKKKERREKKLKVAIHAYILMR